MMPTQRVSLLVCALVLGCKIPGLNGCDRSYCGTITLVDTPISSSVAGFGYQYTGHIDLRFSPSPAAGMTIGAQLNAASIHGTAVTNGSANLQITITGSSVACQFTNPSTWTITDANQPTPVLAFLAFNWARASCA